MDVKWIVDEQIAMVANGGCEYLAVAETQLRALSSPAYTAKIGTNKNFIA